MTRLAIIGDGAMGCMLAYLLSPHADLRLISSWPESLDAISRHGITYERDGRRERRAVAVFADPTLAAPCDIAIVLVKSHQTDWAAETAAALLTPSGLAYTLQNGLGNREILADILGVARAAQGITSLGATLLAPGVVRHGGFGPTVFSRQPRPDSAEALVELFLAAGLPAESSAAVDELAWGKLVVNCGINALSALLRVPNGALVEHPEALRLLRAAVAEAAMVAAENGVSLPYDDPVAHVIDVAQATAHNRSSMLQDVLAARPTEIAAINGAVARIGQRLGVPTPVNNALAQLVAALEDTAAARLKP